MKQKIIEISTSGKGLYEFTKQLHSLFKYPQVGMVNVFIQHTSASLTIQENADPSAKSDLEEFLDRLIPDNEPWHQHTHEGADDTTSHMKSSLTSSSLSIPVINQQLGLGTWQGLYLWEHRHAPHRRKIIVTLME